MTILTIPQLELLIFLKSPMIPKWAIESPGFGFGYGVGDGYGYGSGLGYGVGSGYGYGKESK